MFIQDHEFRAEDLHLKEQWEEAFGYPEREKKNGSIEYKALFKLKGYFMRRPGRNAGNVDVLHVRYIHIQTNDKIDFRLDIGPGMANAKKQFADRAGKLLRKMNR